MQIMKDNLMISIERLEEKNNDSNIAIENVALHCGKITELLAIINDLKKNENFNKQSYNHKESISLKYSKNILPPIQTETSFAHFHMNKR